MDCDGGRGLPLLRPSGSISPVVSYLNGIKRGIQDPSSVPPDSEAVKPSAAEPLATPSATVTPSNKPDCEVMAPSATPSTSKNHCSLFVLDLMCI